MAATTVEGKIADLLLTRLGTLTLDPVLTVAWPNVDFTPPAGAYLEARHLPNTTVNLFVAASDPDMHQGILQVTVVHLQDGGIIAPLEIAAQVAAHFDKGTVIYGTGVTVRIEDRPSIAPALDDGNRVRIPVTIRYRVVA